VDGSDIAVIPVHSTANRCNTAIYRGESGEKMEPETVSTVFLPDHLRA
jgi:hypothetical protein